MAMKAAMKAVLVAVMAMAGASTMAQDPMKNDAMKKDQMASDAMGKDAMGKDAMAKPAKKKPMKKHDAMADGMAKDGMAKDGMKKDEMKKEKGKAGPPARHSQGCGCFSSGRRVSTRAPFLVTATVCSNWADSLPSAVTTVQPSSSVSTSSLPWLSMGSMAKPTSPSRAPGRTARMPCHSAS